MTIGADTLDRVSLWDEFATITSQIKHDYKGRIPHPGDNNNATREDLSSHFAEYFMRHFQAARDVIHSEWASNSDLMTVANILDQLAWADNYFLETYNSEDRRKVEIFISKQLMNPESVEVDMLEAMAMMLDMQINAEREKITNAQLQIDSASKVSDILDWE